MLHKGLIVLSFLFSFSAYGQKTSEEDSLLKRKWYLPDGFCAQYAGGIGMVSAGISYELSKRFSTELSVGYTPPMYGDIWTTNLFTSYTILKPNVTKQLQFKLKAGAYLSYNIGDRIYLKWPEQFHKYYYWWNSALRYGPFINLEGTYIPDKGKWMYSIFLQGNTNDLYIYAYRHSYNAISFDKTIVLGTGIRMEIKKP